MCFFVSLLAGDIGQVNEEVPQRSPGQQSRRPAWRWLQQAEQHFTCRGTRSVPKWRGVAQGALQASKTAVSMKGKPSFSPNWTLQNKSLLLLIQKMLTACQQFILLPNPPSFQPSTLPYSCSRTFNSSSLPTKLSANSSAHHFMFCFLFLPDPCHVSSCSQLFDKYVLSTTNVAGTKKKSLMLRHYQSQEIYS